MKKEKHELYTYQVFWSDADNEFVGTCVEFPGLSHLESVMEDALSGIVDLVEYVLIDMAENNEPIPIPSRAQ